MAFGVKARACVIKKVVIIEIDLRKFLEGFVVISLDTGRGKINELIFN